MDAKQETKEVPKKSHEIFGSFFLGEREFAIPVRQIQEVVAAPDKYTSMPLSPSYLLGLLNLRGMIVPVVDLAALLEFDSVKRDGSGDAKIAILEVRNHLIGLRFDGTSELFSSEDHQMHEFQEQAKESVISGVFKMDEGRRLIQILDVPSLFALDAIPGMEGSQSQQKGPVVRKGLRKQCISFTVGGTACSLGIDEIQEIIKVREVSESLISEKYCMGTINLRGTTVPIIDFPYLLRCGEKSTGEAKSGQRIIIIRIENESFGLLVNSVESIVSFYEEDLKKFPVLSAERDEMFRGCIVLENGSELLLLDSQKILSNKEIGDITHGHSELYAASDETEAFNNQRSTFITFRLDERYAIPIEEVKEIVEEPGALLRPPNLPPACKGMLNLRGDMVAIIDGRSLYLKNESEKKGRVLIFKRPGFHFGVIVDNLEEIITYCESEMVVLPELLYKDQSDGGPIGDVAKALQIKGGDSDTKEEVVLVMSVDSMVDRIRKSA